MKTKIFATLTLALATAAVHADNYVYMAFEAADGSVTRVSIDGLRLSVADGQLIATNAAGQTAFELASLTKMYFAGVTTSISNISHTAAQSPVEVASIAGTRLGRYASLAEAQASLPSGVYIVKTIEGTQKIALK